MRTLSPLHPPRRARQRRGYTLIEIMVAAAVLAIIGFLLVQIMTATTTSTGISTKAVDATSQARYAFDRINLDLKSRLRREDADFRATNLDPDAAILSLISEVTSPGLEDTANRGISVLNYKVDTHPDVTDANGAPRLCLVRAGVPIGWDSTDFLGIEDNGVRRRFDSSTYAYVPADEDYQVVAEGVIRMVVGVRLFPDNELVSLQGDTSSPTLRAQGQLVYRPPVEYILPTDGTPEIELVDPSRIGALVVGVVSLDLESAKLLTNAQLQILADQFTVPDGTTPLETWAPIANNLASDDALNAIPLPARQSVKVYQRAFPITMRMEVK